jgi:23S rRNA-/tRNA-specific pseudouridylate synthase
MKGLHRPFLHSHRLSLLHPVSGKEMTFSAPLPYELKQFLETVHGV